MRMRTSRYALGRLASLKRFCLLALVGLLSTSSPTIGGAGNTVGSNGTDIPAALVNRTPYLTNENSSDFSATTMSKRFAMMGENTGRNRANSFERGLYQFALTMNENGNFEGALADTGRLFLQQLSGQGAGLLTPLLDRYFSLGGNPEWLQRVTVDIDALQYDQPVWSIRTVQPLLQSKSKIHTLFTQLRVGRTDDLGEVRTVTNVGIGYRRLFLDKTVLLGANAHLDRDWNHDHTRTGMGLEARWFGFDWYLNGYMGISGDYTYIVGGKEKVLDGWDSRLLLQIPYVPAMRLVGVVSQWDKTGGTVNDWRTGLEADVTPYTQVQFGVTDSTDGPQGYYFQLRFNLGSYGNRPVLTDRPIRNEAWVMRDMSVHTLDRVRREENIVKEQVTNGVTVKIGRSN